MNLPNEIYLKLSNIFSKYNDIEKVILFGSRAVNKNSNGSDIDLAIFGLDKEEVINLKSDIDDINTLHTFDILIFKDNLDRILKKEILEKGVVIYAR